MITKINCEKENKYCPEVSNLMLLISYLENKFKLF